MHGKRVSRSESICPLQEVPATFSSDTGGQSDRSQRPSGQGGGRGPPPARLTPAQTRTGPLPCPSPTSRHPTPGLSPTPGPSASTTRRASAPTSAPGSSSASPGVSPGSSAPGFPAPGPPPGSPGPHHATDAAAPPPISIPAGVWRAWPRPPALIGRVGSAPPLSARGPRRRTTAPSVQRGKPRPPPANPERGP